MSSTLGVTSTTGLNSFLGLPSTTGSSSNGTSTSGLNLAVSGLASGMDWQTTVKELANAERAPETQWQQRQATINQQNAAFTQIKSLLTTLQTDVQALQDPSLYTSRLAATSNSALGTASATSGATLGTFTFNVTQLGTAAQLHGSTKVGAALSANGNLSAVTLGTAGVATRITAGTFTVDGKQITVATTDSLQQVFDKIASATNNAVTASYNSSPNQPTSDKITLSSANNGEIVLGSATDSSNFLQVAQLYNNGTGSITSTSALGSVRLNGALSDANLTTPVTAGPNGQGSFTINGVSITYDAANDSVQNVLDRINNSAAGVAASFNAQTNGFVLTNNTTGDVGVAVQDVTGNFLAATGLAQGTLAHGKNLLYMLNGGTTQLVSQSNTITQDSSNVTGLSVTALATGSITATVSSDTSKIQTAIQSFTTAYNGVQSYITSQSATSTDSAGKVTAGILTGDQSANNIASSLRSLSFSAVTAPGLSTSLNQLADLGLQTNGQDNTVTLGDASALSTALTNNLSSVQSLFADPTSGLAAQLNKFLTGTIGDNGSLIQHQTSLTRQSSSIDTQVATLEKTITADSARWTAEFQAMEQATAQANQELTYLSQSITNGAL
jgi:flagellar hook-associated protein 2